VRVCFFASVSDRALLELVEFYKQDIDALRGLGHDVRLVNRPADLLRGAADLYWVWWQTSGAPAVLAARARRKPSVLVSALSDNDDSASGMGSKGPAARLAARTSLRLADLVLATSQDTQDGLAGYRTRALRTAPLGVDVDLYRPAARTGEPYVLTISHLTADNVSRKRILDVVRVAALRPELRFLIAGEERDGAPAVRAEIDRLGVGDRVTLAGRVPAEEKRRLLAGAAAYLQPTGYEAFGLAIAEAMASGSVVVSNAVGNVPELVGDTGVLLPRAAAPEEMAGALGALLERPDLDALRQAARDRVSERFSLARRRELVAEAVAEVTGRTGSGRP
jgi:glycosyltransferase involved in cell wall biosynthesis